MNMDLFYDELLEKLKDYYGSGWDINLSYVPKNNGIIRAAFNIRAKDSNIAPAIYCEEFYKMHENGIGIDEIVEHIVEIYNNSCVNNIKVDVDSLNDFDSIRDKLAVRILSKERNNGVFDNFVQRDYLDLIIVPVMCMENDSQSIQSCKVSKSFLNIWNVTEDEVIDMAINNNMTMFPTTCRKLSDLLSEMSGTDIEDIPEIPMVVLSNKAGINGASTILDIAALNNLHDKIGDFIIIPSSIHELLCVPAKDQCIINILDMVKTVNATHVRPEEFLSNNIYRYDGEVISIIFAEEEGDYDVQDNC